MTKRIIAFLMACMIGGTALAKPPVFMTNYESAKRVSNDLGMDILLVFSADWCKYCKMLKKDLSASVSEDELKDLIICTIAVSYTHLRAHETVLDLVCRLLLEKKKK